MALIPENLCILYFFNHDSMYQINYVANSRYLRVILSSDDLVSSDTKSTIITRLSLFRIVNPLNCPDALICFMRK